MTLERLEITALALGDDTRAAPLLNDALALFHKSSLTGGFSLCFAGLAGVAVNQQNVASAQKAARLLASSATLPESCGCVLAPFERTYLHHTTTAARAQLDQAAFIAAWQEGREMPLERAIAYALDEHQSVDSLTAADPAPAPARPAR